jgi:hypothetical protein
MSPSLSSPDFSPVVLSYVGALRGLRPRPGNSTFTYAAVLGDDIDAFLCLCASNPEGRFFGLVGNEATASRAQNIADARNLTNVGFSSSSLSRLVDQADNVASTLPRLDFLVADATTTAFNHETRQTLFTLAEKKLNPNGLFAFRYSSANDAKDNLRFLIAECTPEMTPDQAVEFLTEIKALGALWLTSQPSLAATLNDAIAKATPDLFFQALGSDKPTEPFAFQTMANLLPRGFAFAGDAQIAHNYLELSTPVSAHALLTSCRGSLYYETLKDFAMNRSIRNDLWVRLPADQTTEAGALFGGMTFGITLPREQVPGAATVFGKYIDLTTPLFASMIDLMTTLPMTIGDFLSHPSGQGHTPAEVVEAMHVLVALDVARPLRTGYQGNGAGIGTPQWAIDYNSFHNITPIETPAVRFASRIVGGGVVLPAMDAIVLQAIGRVGLEKSAGAVFLEMQRIAQDPVLASTILKTSSPTPDMADNVTRSIVETSLPRWYAYGLLAA